MYSTDLVGELRPRIFLAGHHGQVNEAEFPNPSKLIREPPCVILHPAAIEEEQVEIVRIVLMNR
jgi:hypothetical protein